MKVNEIKQENLNGRIPVRKSLRWQPDALKPGTATPFKPTDHISHLKSFSKTGQTITIDRLQLGPFIIDNISTNLSFDQNALKMQNLAMNLLGGGIGGNITIAVDDPLQVSAAFEVANLNINQLITTGSKIEGDSQITATVRAKAIVQDDTGAIDLSRLTCDLHISHIGTEALDRLLVFLDPEGNNPTISNARGQLKLANPSQVILEIARGQLHLTIHFQGNLIPSFILDRVPIAKMRNIEKLTAAIPNWSTLSQILETIAAESYSFSPEGGLVLKN